MGSAKHCWLRMHARLQGVNIHLAGNVAFVQALACKQLPHDHGVGVYISSSAHLAILKQLSCMWQAHLGKDLSRCCVGMDHQDNTQVEWQLAE